MKPGAYLRALSQCKMHVLDFAFDVQRSGLFRDLPIMFRAKRGKPIPHILIRSAQLTLNCFALDRSLFMIKAQIVVCNPHSGHLRSPDSPTVLILLSTI